MAGADGRWRTCFWTIKSCRTLNLRAPPWFAGGCWHWAGGARTTGSVPQTRSTVTNSQGPGADGVTIRSRQAEVHMYRGCTRASTVQVEVPATSALPKPDDNGSLHVTASTGTSRQLRTSARFKPSWDVRTLLPGKECGRGPAKADMTPTLV